MAEIQSPDEQLEHPAQITQSAGVGALLIVQAGWILAVMDYNLYFFALPLILVDLKISVPTAGVIFFLSLQGTVVGSLVVPLLADAFGRKRALMGTVLLYALTTCAVAFTLTAAFLTLARFFVTFATGGEQPVGATYIAEVWDVRTRGRALGFMQSGLALGTLLASLLLATVGASFGWRPLFLIGILPAALVVVMRFWLPESRIWAAAREQRHRAAGTSSVEVRQRFSLAQLFAPGLRKLTLIGTILLIAANATNGGIFTWAPTFLRLERGLDIASVGWFGIVLAVGQLIGYNICGWLADMLGRRKTLAIYFCLGILSVVAFGLVTNLPLLAGATFLVGFSLGGMFTGLIIFLSELFPTRARATGVGWCLGVGLFFYSLVPLIIGLLEPSSGFGFLFATITPVACVMGLITLLFAPETKGRELG